MTPETSQLFVQYPWLFPLIIAVAIWSIPWKAVALWKAARLGQKAWFVVIMLVNTAGILEIIYIFAVARGKCCGLIKPEENLPAEKNNSI